MAISRSPSFRPSIVGGAFRECIIPAADGPTGAAAVGSIDSIVSLHIASLKCVDRFDQESYAIVLALMDYCSLNFGRGSSDDVPTIPKAGGISFASSSN